MTLDETSERQIERSLEHTLDGQTQLVGLIGYPVTHSLSPVMHNAAFAALGLNWAYVPLPVRPEALSNALRGIAALGFRGFNVTVPHKIEVMRLMDTNTEAAQIAGAVNTVVIDRTSGRLDGLNTDIGGFMSDLAANQIHINVGDRVIILGAGGAARAVAVGLARASAKLFVVNRTLERAREIVTFLRTTWAQSDAAPIPLNMLGEVTKDVRLVVNTTSLGMYPDTQATPWTEGVPFPREAVLYDTIYRPDPTQLMRDAAEAGLHTVGGLGMLVYQGAAAFEAWTGITPPIAVMRAACERALLKLP